jgi:hypothetical protein
MAADWQPIETFPTDGHTVLVRGTNPTLQCSARWDSRWNYIQAIDRFGGAAAFRLREWREMD